MKKNVLFLLMLTLALNFTTNAQTPEFWGMTSRGGTSDIGVIFKTDANGDNPQTMFNLVKYVGEAPYGSLIQASNGKFYGMTEDGGTNDDGVLFEYDPATDTYTKKFEFDGTNGAYPEGSLIQASNGKLYGMTADGGANDDGVIFEYDLATDTYTKKFEFDWTNGAYPFGSLIQASNDKLYGMTNLGGANNKGVIFEYDLTTDTYTKKFEFDGNNGAHPYGSLIQASNGKLYGMTVEGGANGFGVIFEYDLATDTFTKKLDFDGTNGTHPYGCSLIQASNGKLYGMTDEGGANNEGVLFEYDPATDTYTKKLDFDGTNGAYPFGALIQASNGKFYGMTEDGGANDDGVIFEYDPATDTYTKKFDFDGNNGSYPEGSLIQASNGKLYGMTSEGGTNDAGVIFEYDLATDTYTKKLEFDGNNGAHPYGSLIQASNGKLYGMTSDGSTNDAGVLFEYDSTTDTYTKKLDFDGTNGAEPYGALIQASNGKLYGMTKFGGANNTMSDKGGAGAGVLFEYDLATDTYTKKFDFDGTNGAYPDGSLIQASNGKLYGMTEMGGNQSIPYKPGSYGVIFEYDLATDTYTKKFDFDGTNGANPYGSLIQASNGKLYGMTADGGANGYGVIFEYDLATDTYTKKFDFDANDGTHPEGSLMQASNGKLYGMTEEGGANDDGVIFEYDLATDTYTKKLDFDGPNGAGPYGALIQASNGKFYGMTEAGGANGYGVIFEYDLATDTYTKKLDFDGTNGSKPYGSLIEVNASSSIENQTNITINISPNPTKNLVKISLSEKPVNVSVVNLAGVLIYETDQTSKEMSLDMSNYANAVYLVKIQTNKGMATYKVIKQ